MIYIKLQNDLLKKLLQTINFTYEETKLISSYYKKNSKDFSNNIYWRVLKFFGVFFVGAATITSALYLFSFDRRFKPLQIVKNDKSLQIEMQCCKMFVSWDKDNNNVRYIYNPLYWSKTTINLTPKLLANSGEIKRFKVGIIDNYTIEIADLKNNSKLPSLHLTDKKFINADVEKFSDGELNIQFHEYSNIKLFTTKLEGYDNQVVYTTYVLLDDTENSKKITIYPLYESDITNTEKIRNIFNEIQKNKSYIWKDIKFSDISEFKNYLMQQRKLFIKELNELGE